MGRVDKFHPNLRNERELHRGLSGILVQEVLHVLWPRSRNRVRRTTVAAVRILQRVSWAVLAAVVLSSCAQPGAAPTPLALPSPTPARTAPSPSSPMATTTFTPRSSPTPTQPAPTLTPLAAPTPYPASTATPPLSASARGPWDPACPEVSKPPLRIGAPGELAGTVCGLDPSGQVTLRLRPVLGHNSFGEPVLTSSVGNGSWKLPATSPIPPGGYILDVITEGLGVVTVPRAYTVFAKLTTEAGLIPKGVITFRYAGLAFEVVKRDRAAQRFGLQLCDSPVEAYSPLAGGTPTPMSPSPATPAFSFPPGVTPPPSLTPIIPPGPPPRPGTIVPSCAAAHLAEREIGGPIIAGELKGLTGGDTASVRVHLIPQVPGRCYLIGLYEPSTGCTEPPGPEPLESLGDLTGGREVVEFSAGGSMWALAGDMLEVRSRYVVVVTAESYQVRPAAYAVDLPERHLVPTWIRGLDFLFAPKRPQ